MSRENFEVLELAGKFARTYREEIHSKSPRPSATLASLRGAFGGPVPATGRPAARVLEELRLAAEPGLAGTTGGRFFAWVFGGSHPAGVAADILTSAWGQNAALYLCSPAAAVAEEVAGAWLLELLALPKACSVGFTSSATTAIFTGLAAARSEVLRKVGWDVERDGLAGAPPVTILLGEEAHTTVFAALQYLGFGRSNLTTVESDGQGRIKSAAFERVLGKTSGPAIAILQAGHIASGAFDPFAELVPMAQAKDAWVHVDGAFGLWARVSEKTRSLAEGVEAADSWAVDGHKWLQTPYDCGFAICRNPEAHRRAMLIAASYLDAEGLGQFEPSHFVPELSRRGRGFAVWAVIKALGREGIAGIVDTSCRLARKFAGLLSTEPGVTVVNEVDLNQVCVAFGGGLSPAKSKAVTQLVIDRVLNGGVCFVQGAEWKGRWVMRLSLNAYQTNDEDVERSAAAIIACWREVRGVL